MEIKLANRCQESRWERHLAALDGLEYKDDCMAWVPCKNNTIFLNLDFDWKHAKEDIIFLLVVVLTHESIHLILDSLEGTDTSKALDHIFRGYKTSTFFVLCE